MFKKKIYRLCILLIGIVGIALLTGCHATQSSYLQDDYYYPYDPYPPYYYAYYPYPYYYSYYFFGTDFLIIQSNQQVISQPRSSGPRGRILMGGSLGVGGSRGLSSGSSRERRSLER